MATERPTFSQSWSRVSRLTPTLRPQVRVHRQLFRGEPWHIVQDPVSNSFFRLNPVAWHLVGLLDGKRSVDDVWRLTLDRFGDAAPTQNEVIGLLGQLNQSNLLRVDLPSDAEPLLRRQRQRVLKQWGGRAMSILFLQIPLFNPERFLNWLTPMMRPLLSKWGLMLWAVWIGYGLYMFLPHTYEFIRSADSVLAPANWLWMMIMFVIIKAIHETGHGLVCTRLGGRVTEVGVLMMVMLPAPYVDTTTSWSFSDKWKRLLVAAAGMIFELAVAVVAALVWIYAEPETLVRQLAYNVVFLASVTTIIFNANPLLRYDGYYMLSDLIEVPNLYQRSTNYMKWAIQRYVYGMKHVQSVTSLPFEHKVLPIYGVLSLIYRMFVLFTITLFVMGQMLILGVLIAMWSVIAWAFVPAGKFLHWLITSPALQEKRRRAILTTAAFVAVLVGVLGFIPASDHRFTQGVVEGDQRSDVSMQSDGFIRQVMVESGDQVTQDQIMFVADNPELSARQKELLAEKSRIEIAIRQGLAQDMVEHKKNQARLDAVMEDLNSVNERLSKLTVRAPQDGVIVGPHLASLIGQFKKRGDLMCQVVDMSSLRITAMIDQADNAAFFRSQIDRVEIRTAGMLGYEMTSGFLMAFDAGTTRLPHPALGYQGGGQIATDQKDAQGMTATKPHIPFWFSLPKHPTDTSLGMSALPGERVHIRFTFSEKRPLLVQWIHRLRQLIRDRVSF